MQKSVFEHPTTFEGGLMLEEEGVQYSSSVTSTQEREGIVSVPFFLGKEGKS